MIFRTYDIRGVVGETLTPEIVEKIGLAFGSEMSDRQQSDVIVGRDNRPSSMPFSEALMAGVRATGLNTIDIGEVATPIVYHASVTSNNTPAIMITGSHLPPDRNGFKMTQGLTPFYGNDIQMLKERIESDDFVRGAGQHHVEQDAASRYMADVAGRFGAAEQTFNVVVDAGNGMAGLFAPTLVRYLLHNAIELYCDSDGSYPNHPADPFEEENLLEAKGVLLTQGADLAIAFDGDADRVGIIDHTGVAHTTDRVLIPIVWDILKKHPGAHIITDSLVSNVLIETIKQSGGVPVMWKSGHSNIKMKMKEVNAPLALETSGHVFIADNYYGYDDGMYTALRLLELLGRAKTAPLAEIMAEVPQLHTTPQFRPVCPEDKKQTVIDAIAKKYRKADVNTIDGVRVTLPYGWFICRASNTEPKLSLRFEADSEDALGTLVSDIENILKTFDILLR